MPVTCLVWSCTSKGIMPGISFHRLGKARYASWLNAIGRNPDENISPTAVICSKHFLKSDFLVNRKRVILKDDAVPQLFLPKNAPFTSKPNPRVSHVPLHINDGNCSSSDSASHPRSLIMISTKEPTECDVYPKTETVEELSFDLDAKSPLLASQWLQSSSTPEEGGNSLEILHQCRYCPRFFSEKKNCLRHESVCRLKTSLQNTQESSQNEDCGNISTQLQNSAVSEFGNSRISTMESKKNVYMKEEIGEESTFDLGTKFPLQSNQWLPSSPSPEEDGNNLEILHQCRHCYSSFSAKKNCRRHEFVCRLNPEGERTYKIYSCSYCDARYSRADNLKAHLKRHEISVHNTKEINENETFDQDSKCPLRTSQRHQSSPSRQQRKNISSILYMCNYCSRSFSERKKCMRHESICHLNPEGRTIYSCSRCGSKFSRPDSLKFHLKRHETSVQKTQEVNQNETCRNISPLPLNFTVPGHDSAKIKKSKSQCHVKGCEAKIYHRRDLISHIRHCHPEVTVKDPVELKFHTLKEFYKWKEEEEERTFSYFYSKTGQLTSQDTKLFYCQHDGSAKPHSGRKTSNKWSRHTIKKGLHCIAKIKASVLKDCILVEYLPTHNHDCSSEDFKYQPIKPSTARFINREIARGVSPTTIYDKIRERVQNSKVENYLLRDNQITKKQIQNRARKIRNALIFHRHDQSRPLEDEEEEELCVIFNENGENITSEEESENLDDGRKVYHALSRLETNLATLSDFIAICDRGKVSDDVIFLADDKLNELILGLEHKADS